MQLNLNFEQQKNAKALGITLAVHLILLLFFLFFKYAMPTEQPDTPLGLEVNLGTSLNAFGNKQPEHIGSPTNVIQPQNASSGGQSGQNISPHGLMQSHNEKAPAVSINNHNNHANSHATNNTQKVVKNPKFIYPGSNGNGNGNEATRNHDGNNEGIGTGNGDMGVPAGTPGAENYSGIPGGYGNVSAVVGKRYLIAKPKPKAKYKEGGKVVFRVTVNRNGKITDYSIKSAANLTLRNIAIQKLKAIQFNKDQNARPEEFGIITFDFKAHH